MSGPATYAPLDVLKPVGPDIWIIDGPVIRFYGLPFTTRATVVKLPDGTIWLHSPTQHHPDLQKAVEAIGPIRHLVAPNWIHYAYVGQWQAALPEVTVWAAPGVAERAASRKVEIRIDHELGDTAPPDWGGALKSMVVRGSHVHHEAVFFHEASRTLILTDLIENFEPRMIPWWMRIVAKPAKLLAPDGQMPRDMRLTFKGRYDLLRTQVETMIGWNPDKVIIAHGAWFERDGVAELRRAFRFVLD